MTFKEIDGDCSICPMGKEGLFIRPVPKRDGNMDADIYTVLLSVREFMAEN